MWHNSIVQNLSDPQGVTDYPQLDLDRQLCFSFYAVSRAVTTRYGQLLSEVGLTYPQYLVMLALWGARSLTVSELGKHLRLDSGTLSPLLKRLQSAGLVIRERDTADERRVLIRPTAEGWQLRDRVAHVPAAIASAMGLDTESYVELKTRVASLLENLDLGRATDD
jgi:DNA-binding MarR family transcriptional regulator